MYYRDLNHYDSNVYKYKWSRYDDDDSNIYKWSPYNDIQKQNIYSDVDKYIEKYQSEKDIIGDEKYEIEKKKRLVKSLSNYFYESMISNNIEDLHKLLDFAHTLNIIIYLDKSAINYLVRYKWIDLVDKLLEYGYINISFNFNRVLTECLRHRDLDRFRYYIDKYNVDIKYNINFFINSCINADLKSMVFEFIDEKYISLNKALLIILQHKYSDNTKSIILEMMNHKQCDMSKYSSKFLLYACSNWDIEIVSKVLSNKKVDPSVLNNKAISVAVKRNKIDIVKLLLKDERVKPDTLLLIYAYENKFIDIFELLLSDYRIDPSGENDKLIRSVIRRNDLELAKRLLKDERVKPDTLLLIYAYENKFIDIFELLLSDYRIDPSGENDKLIRSVIRRNDLELAKRLLKDNRIDASKNRNECLKFVIDRYNTEGINLLLRQSKVLKNIYTDKQLYDYMVIRKLIPDYKSKSKKNKVIRN